METKEFVCHGGIGDADHGNEQPCPAGPCIAAVKAGYSPCYCLLFGSDGEHIPNWEESCAGQVIASDTDVIERVSSATGGPLSSTEDILKEAVEERVSDPVVRGEDEDADLEEYLNVRYRILDLADKLDGMISAALGCTCTEQEIMRYLEDPENKEKITREMLCAWIAARRAN